MIHFIKATNYAGLPKDIQSIQHLLDSPIGTWASWIEKDKPFLFRYGDNSGIIMKSSPVKEHILCLKHNLIKHKIITQNTIYYFEEDL